MSNGRLSEIEAIGPKYVLKLEMEGITKLSDLLQEGETRSGRKKLAEDTGISEKLLLGWVHLADLFRIRGIGQEYADLLKAAGVDTVPELAQRNPDNLHEKLIQVNEKKKLVFRNPGLAEVDNWVSQAKQLPRAIKY